MIPMKGVFYRLYKDILEYKNSKENEKIIIDSKDNELKKYINSDKTQEKKFELDEKTLIKKFRDILPIL
jgi:hypothetical protein